MKGCLPALPARNERQYGNKRCLNRRFHRPWLLCGLSLLGLSAVLLEYHWLAWVVRVLGGCYLAYLGIRLLFSKPAGIDSAPEGAKPRGNALVFGFLVTLTNPKEIILFTSVFAPAVSQQTPLWLIGLMIALVITSSLVWYGCVSYLMFSAPVLRRFKNARHWIERAAGVCFIAIGGRILADSRNPLTP